MNEPTKTKSVIYTRFSPRPDQEVSDSDEKQEELCRLYAKKYGYSVEAVFTDRCKSRNDAGREGVLEAIDTLKRDWVLVCYDESRFGAGMTAILLEDMVYKRKARIEFTTGTPGDDPNKKMIRHIMYAIAERQREIIGARTRFKMRQHQDKGRVMSKCPPYGKKRDPENPKMWVDNPDEQDVIAYIVAQLDTGIKYTDLVIDLNAKYPPRGEKWHRSSVHKIYHRWKKEQETMNV